jgi:hypothetical protein
MQYQNITSSSPPQSRETIHLNLQCFARMADTLLKILLWKFHFCIFQFNLFFFARTWAYIFIELLVLICGFKKVIYCSGVNMCRNTFIAQFFMNCIVSTSKRIYVLYMPEKCIEQPIFYGVEKTTNFNSKRCSKW